MVDIGKESLRSLRSLAPESGVKVLQSCHSAGPCGTANKAKLKPLVIYSDNPKEVGRNRRPHGIAIHNAIANR